MQKSHLISAASGASATIQKSIASLLHQLRFCVESTSRNSSSSLAGADLTAAVCGSYFTGSQRRRATSPSWLIRGHETNRLASARERSEEPRSLRPVGFLHTTPTPRAREDECFWEVWTLRTAARSGKRDLVDRSRWCPS